MLVTTKPWMYRHNNSTGNNKPLPVPAFTLLPGCAGTTVTLTNNTLDSVINWNWNFGNGQVSTQQNPTIVSDSGTYNVSVTITDVFGCTGTANVP